MKTISSGGILKDDDGFNNKTFSIFATVSKQYLNNFATFKRF